MPRDRALSTAKTSGRLRVLFFVDGFTDIRFVVGLSEVCDLTMALPARVCGEHAQGASRVERCTGQGS